MEKSQFAENDKEINEQFFELRNYDPLLARFSSIDPYEQFHSPYLAMGNNHSNQVDMDGGWSPTGFAIGAASGMVVGAAISIINHDNMSFEAQVATTAGLMLAGSLIGGNVDKMWYIQKVAIEYGPVFAKVTDMISKTAVVRNVSINRYYRSGYGGTFIFDTGPDTFDRIQVTGQGLTVDNNGSGIGITAFDINAFENRFYGDPNANQLHVKINNPNARIRGSYFTLTKVEDVQTKTTTHTKFLFGVIPFSRTKSVGTNNIFRNGRQPANSIITRKSPKLRFK
jgi:hypothetical protein